MRRFWGSAFTTALDVVSESAGFYPAIGVEYKILKLVSLRAGYKGDGNLDQQFTYGVGFENPLFRLDYAFVPFQDLGDAHRISVHYSFGKSYRRSKADDLLRQKIEEAKTLYAQGLLVDAYLAASQIQHVAPWMDENNKLITRIQKDFKELEESDRREKLNLQITAIQARAEKFFQEGNLINARIDFEAVLGLQPGNKVAQGYIKHIEAQFKSFVQSFYRNGMIALAGRNYEKAKEEFEKVLVIDPNHAEAKEQLVKVVTILEKKEKAAAEEAQKQSISKTYQEALKAYQNDHLEEAIPLFNAILALQPNHQDAQRYRNLARETLFKRYLDKGKELASRGDWETAVRNLRTASEYNPGTREVKTLLEDVQRRWEFQKKVQSQNLYKQGLEAFLSGDKNKAKELWQKALTLDPDNEEAKRGLSRITVR
jgi:tetratricopeptide (TPR) repeat protein